MKVRVMRLSVGLASMLALLQAAGAPRKWG
jgi:hypothetical protein